MMNLLKKQRPSTVLGLALDGNRLEAVVVRRTNGHVNTKEFAGAALALSPLSGDPELVGREIRNHLDHAGIRERNCAVCIPLSWALTLQTKLPDLPEEDIGSFLDIEAERGFHSGPENLFIARSRSKAADGAQYVTMIAVPRNHLATLEQVLKAAKLKPVTFSLGVSVLGSGSKEMSDGMLTLGLGSNSVDLQVTAGGGIVALRSLDGAIETEGSQKRIDAELVARELRITIGQLPSGFGAAAHRVKVYGRGDMARQFMKDIAAREASLGLKFELMDRASAADFDKPAPAEIAVSPALALAASYVKGLTGAPGLLPPKVNAWQQLINTKLGSKKLAWAGGAAGAVVFCVVASFLFQEWELVRWKSRWQAIEPQVTEAQNALDQIRKYRPWFDQEIRSLKILQELTKAFPETGSVTAKTVEIRDLTQVSCSGVADNRRGVESVMEKLGSSDGITDLNPESIRAQSPGVQFTLTFQFEGVPSGN